jgi:hypothetical protein
MLGCFCDRIKRDEEIALQGDFGSGQLITIACSSLFESSLSAFGADYTYKHSGKFPLTACARTDGADPVALPHLFLPVAGDSGR